MIRDPSFCCRYQLFSSRYHVVNNNVDRSVLVNCLTVTRLSRPGDVFSQLT